MSNQEIPNLKGGEVSRFITELAIWALLSCVVISVFAVVQLARHGFINDYIILLAGSLLSALAIIGYSLLSLVPKDRKGVLLMFVPLFAGGIPYLFGSYLVFYRGFWSLRSLFSDVSLMTILAALFFIVLGYNIVRGIHRVTEFVRSVSEGKITVQ